MAMSLPILLIYGVFGVINSYLPLFLRDLGYSVSLVGILLSIYEIAGLVFPMIISPFVSGKGKYGAFLVAFGIIILVLSWPLVTVSSFWISVLCLVTISVGTKSIGPVSDAFTNQLLGPRRELYGRVRVMGSIGFVISTLIMQFSGNIAAGSPFQRYLWIAVPASLFILSMFLIPGLMKPIPDMDRQSAGGQKEPRVRSGGGTGLFSMLKEFSPAFWFGLALIFFGFMGLVPPQRFISLYVEEYLHINAVAGLWALSAMSEIPFMFFADRFLRRFGSVPLIIFCLAAIFLRCLSYILIPSLAGAVIGQLFNSVTYGLFHPVAVLFVAERAPKKYMVFGMSLYSIFAVGGASVIGNFIGGFIIDSLGYPALFIFFALFPLIGIALYMVNRKKKAIVL